MISCEIVFRIEPWNARGYPPPALRTTPAGPVGGACDQPLGLGISVCHETSVATPAPDRRPAGRPDDRHGRAAAGRRHHLRRRGRALGRDPEDHLQAHAGRGRPLHHGLRQPGGPAHPRGHAGAALPLPLLRDQPGHVQRLRDPGRPHLHLLRADRGHAERGRAGGHHRARDHARLRSVTSPRRSSTRKSSPGRSWPGWRPASCSGRPGAAPRRARW